jgi:hypothetical protein
MFGHDDTTTKPNDNTEPVEDGTLSSQPPITALPPVDNTASNDTPAAPSAIPTPSSASDFIATDDKGQPDTSAPSVSPAAGGELLDIKQQALKQLSPLVGHLNQSAEEKFRTTMMMIQASDDQSLIPTAYAAAKEISDEKTRAQALLDIINEINYFTQQQHDQD